MHKEKLRVLLTMHSLNYWLHPLPVMVQEDPFQDFSGIILTFASTAITPTHAQDNTQSSSMAPGCLGLGPPAC